MNDSPTTRFADRAAAEGLLDVAYTLTDSPFGDLLLAATPRGLVRVGLPSQDSEDLLQDLASRVSPRVLEAPGRLDDARRELDNYFEGRLRDFDLPLDWRLSKDFRPAHRCAHSIRGDTQLRAGREGRGQRAGRARGRHGVRHQPDPDRRSLPPRAAQRRRAGRLRRRAVDEAGPARDGGGSGRRCHRLTGVDAGAAG